MVAGSFPFLLNIFWAVDGWLAYYHSSSTHYIHLTSNAVESFDSDSVSDHLKVTPEEKRKKRKKEKKKKKHQFALISHNIFMKPNRFTCLITKSLRRLFMEAILRFVWVIGVFWGLEICFLDLYQKYFFNFDAFECKKNIYKLLKMHLTWVFTNNNNTFCWLFFVCLFQGYHLIHLNLFLATFLFFVS